MAYYAIRADGVAANKGAAAHASLALAEAASAATAMSVTTHNAETFAAGDTIVVSGLGGKYDTKLAPPTDGATGTGNRITYLGSNSPVIDVGASAGTGAWALTGGQTYTYERADLNTAYYIVYDTTNYRPLIVKTSIAEVEATTGSYWLDAVNDKIYIHPWDDLAPSLTYYGITSATAYCVDVNNKDYLTITGLYLYGGYTGIRVYGGSDYVTANYNYLKAQYDAAIARGAGTTNVIFEYNDASYCGNGFRAYATGDAADTVTIRYNNCSYMNYYSETTADGECYSNQGCSNVTIEQNTGDHFKYALVSIYAPDATALDNVKVNRNYGINSKTHGVVFGGTGTGNYTNSQGLYNIVNANGDSAAGAGLYLTRDGNGSLVANNVARGFPNNIQRAATGVDWKIYNNISLDPVSYHMVGATGAGTDTLADNNCYYHASGTKNWAWNGTARTSLALYVADAGGQETNAINSNPLFVNSSGAYTAVTDFTLRANSPARSVADRTVYATISGVYDYRGVPISWTTGTTVGWGTMPWGGVWGGGGTIVVKDPLSMGAYEWIGGGGMGTGMGLGIGQQPPLRWKRRR